MESRRVTNVQVWVLTGVLTISLSMLGVFSYSMYETFNQLQKSVTAIAQDIAIIKNDQRHQSNDYLRLQGILDVHDKALNLLEKRVTKLEPR